MSERKKALQEALKAIESALTPILSGYQATPSEASGAGTAGGASEKERELARLREILRKKIIVVNPEEAEIPLPFAPGKPTPMPTPVPNKAAEAGKEEKAAREAAKPAARKAAQAPVQPRPAQAPAPMQQPTAPRAPAPTPMATPPTQQPAPTPRPAPTPETTPQPATPVQQPAPEAPTPTPMPSMPSPKAAPTPTPTQRPTPRMMSREEARRRLRELLARLGAKTAAQPQAAQQPMPPTTTPTPQAPTPAPTTKQQAPQPAPAPTPQPQQPTPSHGIVPPPSWARPQARPATTTPVAQPSAPTTAPAPVQPPTAPRPAPTAPQPAAQRPTAPQQAPAPSEKTAPGAGGGKAPQPGGGQCVKMPAERIAELLRKMAKPQQQAKTVPTMKPEVLTAGGGPGVKVYLVFVKSPSRSLFQKVEYEETGAEQRIPKNPAASKAIKRIESARTKIYSIAYKNKMFQVGEKVWASIKPEYAIQFAEEVAKELSEALVSPEVIEAIRQEYPRTWRTVLANIMESYKPRVAPAYFHPAILQQLANAYIEQQKEALRKVMAKLQSASGRSKYALSYRARKLQEYIEALQKQIEEAIKSAEKSGSKELAAIAA